jgi:CubicO group peptidase (beta-lactamase class C family)
MSDLAVSVISPSGSVTSLGYSAEGETPDESSLFVIGSLGKPIVAATTLLLVEDGLLDLDEPIERWLPEFPRADEITLRQLLSHTAGMANPIHAGARDQATFAAYGEPIPVADLLAEAANSVGDGDLPAAHSYSNPGYFVVGAVIEAATGEPVADVLRARIFGPLGMAASYSAWSEPVDEPLVPGEVTFPDGTVIPLGSEVLPGMVTGSWVAGGMVSSARDVALFFSALFDDLLASASLEALKTPHSSSYGLGVRITTWPGGTTGWWHDGAIDGYGSAAGVTDEGWTVAVLSNHFDVAAGGPDPNLIDLVGELVAQVAPEA